MIKMSTIRLSNKTKEKLRAIEKSPDESYESIILRLLETKVVDETIEYLIYDNECSNCQIKIVIDWGNPFSNIQYLNRDGNLLNEIPEYDFEDGEEQSKWDNFKSEVEKLDNIRSICAILDEGEISDFGNIAIKRI